MGNTTHAQQNTTTQGNELHAAGRFALQRHAEARARAPKRSAAIYLRLALTCARQLARLAPQHPDFWMVAQTLVAEIIIIARDHEAQLFALGGNQGSAYISVWISADALRLQIADKCAQFAPADKDPVPTRDPAELPYHAPDDAPPLAASRAPASKIRARIAPVDPYSAQGKGRKPQRPRQKTWW